jgi:putative DNA-binding protein
MSLPLGAFQQQFAQAMRGHETPAAALCTQPGFAVYRNTWLKACIDALEANFPAVACLVGQAWFRSAAALYASESMPADGRMTHYGDDFADFLDVFEGARDMSYLADVARLDWLLLASCHAADAPTLAPEDLATLPAQDLRHRTLCLHPSVRWHESVFPARTIWEASRGGRAVEGDLAWTGEATLIVRRAERVYTMPVDQATCGVLESIRAGRLPASCIDTLAHLHHAPRLDASLAFLLTAGAFTSAASPATAKDHP